MNGILFHKTYSKRISHKKKFKVNLYLDEVGLYNRLCNSFSFTKV